ncbi:MAG: TIGR02757 family protein [Desulfamplus sp.]|nr:TIGR02757 family protein [Desulfamplus sp.]
MTIKGGSDLLREQLDIIYGTYNKKEYIHPDPLEFLDNYPDPGEREIAALIAASLAYGRVDQILKHVALVFKIMCQSGHAFPLDSYPLNAYLMQNKNENIADDFRHFKYRFTKGEHLVYLLFGIKEILREFGSLKLFFLNAISPEDKNILPALTRFIQKITAGKSTGNLLADPQKGSACKRNNLFLRWLVRKDAVDPGGWDEIPSSMLVVPLDTHMHHAGKILGFTKRKQADMKTALEITEGFRELSPDDPVKYDFCLTRFGIRPDMNFNDLETIIKKIKGGVSDET